MGAGIARRWRRRGSGWRRAATSESAAVIVPVPDAEAAVGRWRERYDPSATRGMPAHVTTLYPFLCEERLGDDTVAELARMCAQVPAMTVTFRRLARFPDVLYLAPEPAERLAQLTVAIEQRWPEAPAYGGAFEEVIPHLTVAGDTGDGALSQIEATVGEHLPLTTTLVEAALYVFDGTRWQLRARLPFRASDSGSQPDTGA